MLIERQGINSQNKCKSPALLSLQELREEHDKEVGMDDLFPAQVRGKQAAAVCICGRLD